MYLNINVCMYLFIVFILLMYLCIYSLIYLLINLFIYNKKQCPDAKKIF